MNEISCAHYTKNKEKVEKIKEEVCETNTLCITQFNQFKKKDNKLLDYYKKIDDIDITIEGMESSVEYISTLLDRIGIYSCFIQL